MSRALKRIFHVEEELPDYSSYADISTDIGNHGNAKRSKDSATTVAGDNCVIQCPSCFTRFALPFSAIAEQADPRFHCSQCDTIFRAEVEDSAPIQQNGALSQPDPHGYSSTPNPSVLNPIESSFVPNEIVDTLVSSSLDDIKDPQVFSSANDSNRRYSQNQFSEPAQASSAEHHESLTANSTSKSFEIPRSVETNWSLGPPHESAANSAQLHSFTSAVGHTPSDKYEPSQMSLGLAALNTDSIDNQRNRDQSKSRDLNEGQGLATFPRSDSGSSKKQPKPNEPKSRAKRGEVAIRRRQLLLSSVQKMRINVPLGKWRAPLVIAGPLLTFCLALFFISALLKTNPLQSEEIITSAIPGITRVAPPGLAVIEAKIRKIVLDSGETVYALSGRVKNNSGKLIKRVSLDGLVFDKQGMLLGEKQVLVSSPLAQSKIKSLTLEMIEDIEANASKGKTTVKDGESAPFVVTFKPQEVAGARYFSTRINSIK